MSDSSNSDYLSETQTKKYLNISKKSQQNLAVQRAGSLLLCEVKYKNDSLPLKGSGSVDEGKNIDDWLRTYWMGHYLVSKKLS